ncbi:MAG: adenylate/guanylate cyclase domain-containing protein [Sneathiella sp.]|uniref:adenylate/guanylate cyclase domain-containing protein n=1 Tax=Sneathiella sp. TaxID=1964365 RepID=UPI003002E0E7
MPPQLPLEKLLLERERQGVRTLSIVRGIFVLILMVSAWVLGSNWFEKVTTTVICLILLGPILFSLFLLSRSRAVGFIGIAGCLLDIMVLAILPVIWYISVGGNDVPPAYMLKTQLTIITLFVISANTLAIRPLYPMLVAAGSVCIHIILLLYILNDPRTVVSPDYVDSVMGPALTLEFAIGGILVVIALGTVMTYLATIARRMVIEGVRLEISNTQLGRYFSPGVVSSISSGTGTLSGLGGRSQNVAVMFCDIRDFTTISEPLSLSEVVGFLSEYHTKMVEVIFTFGGTIDKFIGDAIMVTFGTPDPKDDDAERAVRAGLAMNAALEDLNKQRKLQGLAEIKHGIGIHFGSVIAGNIGTEERLEYTVIGDTVNVASRIQDTCKSADQTLLISDAVSENLPDDIQRQYLQEQYVKGRQAPVNLYMIA